MKYYISDLHFFHTNILKLANRPFNSIEDMNDTIIKNWEKTVGDKDTVYILGDVALYNQKPTAAILKSLPGKKILIIGNHDVKNLKNPDFRSCFAEAVPYKEIKDDGRKVVLFHYPIEEWDGYYRDFYHLHGHVHSNDKNLQKLPKRFNVSADVINYTPITLDELITKFS